MWTWIYQQLQQQYPTLTIENWWGIDDPFERMVGAVLVQNTTWTNAAKAIECLRRHDMLSPEAIASRTAAELVPIIHSAGFQQRKAETIITLCSWLLRKGGLAFMQTNAAGTEELRHELLALRGIGEETADTILAYAFYRPTISGDAYARRLYERLTGERGQYGQIRTAILSQLQEWHALSLLHALIVEHGKWTCRKRDPVCVYCRLQEKCRQGKALAAADEGEVV